MSTPNDGGPAFPVPPVSFKNRDGSECTAFGGQGMTFRDWLAGQAMGLSMREVEDISRCDDQDLIQRFGTLEEQDEFFTLVTPGHPIPWKNIELRAKLEARARARLRYIEADAMLKARENKE